MADVYFSVREYRYSSYIDGFLILVVTDIPCHLFMRYSTVKPQTHTLPVLRRGLRMHDDVYLCFVAYHDNEQEEAGDTLLHTFIKTPWPVCETRFFHFWGYIAGEVAKSTTALFELHFKGFEYELLILEPWTRFIIPPPDYSLYFLETWDS